MTERARKTLEWLLAGDPAIRWQTRRDLTGASERALAREQRRVAVDGWGARLLAHQDPVGTWAGRMYSPKWTSTTYTMLLLRDLGLPPRNRAAKRACALLLDRGLQGDGGIGYGWGRSETCVTGMVLSILAWFRYPDGRVDEIAAHLLDQQMPDGGWNCRRPKGATHASMNTTILALEGLHLYEQHRGDAAGLARAVGKAQGRGREFLLAHQLFRSHRTGAIIKRDFVRLAFPPHWHYDFLRALDHFRAVDAPRDPRLGDAIALLEQKRRSDGRWNLEHRHKPDRVWFQMERIRSPSRWNTLRALRVLAWWYGSAAAPRASRAKNEHEAPDRARSARQSRVTAILEEIRALGSERNRAGMAKYGINVERAFGVSVYELRKVAKRLGRDHALALALWDTGNHEGRLLACFVDDPAQVTAAQTEQWAREFDSWDICDQATTSLFDLTKHAWTKAAAWADRDEMWVKRGAFALLAGLAVHDKAAPDQAFIEMFPHIERAAFDERNFVKKAVNWALRNIGKRNRELNEAAIACAERIRTAANQRAGKERGGDASARSARWVAADAMRELASDKIRARLGGDNHGRKSGKAAGRRRKR